MTESQCLCSNQEIKYRNRTEATQVLWTDYFYYKYTVLKWNGTWHCQPFTAYRNRQTKKYGVCAADLQSSITHTQHKKQNSHSSQTPQRPFWVHMGRWLWFWLPFSSARFVKKRTNMRGKWCQVIKTETFRKGATSSILNISTWWRRLQVFLQSQTTFPINPSAASKSQRVFIRLQIFVTSASKIYSQELQRKEVETRNHLFFFCSWLAGTKRINSSHWVFSFLMQKY